MISIIVPVYKTEKYLERCVNSILNQTYSDVELILVDDGSPDNCPQVCDQFARLDSRVRVIHKDNGGVSTARNVGLDTAQGEYISFVDSDDWIEPGMYEKMMVEAKKYNADIVMCDCVKDFENCSEIYSHDIRGGFYEREQLVQEYYPHLLIMENIEYPATISNCTMLWRSSMNTQDQRYRRGVRYSEDLLFGAKLLRRASSFVYMKGEALYHYTMNPASASHTFVSDKWYDYQLLHKGIKEEFGQDKEYDFSSQIHKCLLFFLYNTVGELFGAELPIREKRRRILTILRTQEVREMFGDINVMRLPISLKQKVITLIYKYRLGVSLLIVYYSRK